MGTYPVILPTVKCSKLSDIYPYFYVSFRICPMSVCNYPAQEAIRVYVHWHPNPADNPGPGKLRLCSYLSKPNQATYKLRLGLLSLLLAVFCPGLNRDVVPCTGEGQAFVKMVICSYTTNRRSPCQKSSTQSEKSTYYGYISRTNFFVWTLQYLVHILTEHRYYYLCSKDWCGCGIYTTNFKR